MSPSSIIYLVCYHISWWLLVLWNRFRWTFFPLDRFPRVSEITSFRIYGRFFMVLTNRGQKTSLARGDVFALVVALGFILQPRRPLVYASCSDYPRILRDYRTSLGPSAAPGSTILLSTLLAGTVSDLLTLFFYWKPVPPVYMVTPIRGALFTPHAGRIHG